MISVNNNYLWADRAMLNQIIEGVKKLMPYVDIVVDSFSVYEGRDYDQSLDTFSSSQSITFEGTVYYKDILVGCLYQNLDCTEESFNEYFTEIANTLLKEDRQPDLCPGVDIYFHSSNESKRNELVKYKIVEKIKAYTTSEMVYFLVLENTKGELSIEFSDSVYTLGE